VSTGKLSHGHLFVDAIKNTDLYVSVSHITFACLLIKSVVISEGLRQWGAH